MKKSLAEMTDLYRDYSISLRKWIEELRIAEDPTDAFASLSEMEKKFFAAARAAGDRVDTFRGAGVTLRQAAESHDALTEFDSASQAVAEVSVEHVRAVRELEEVRRKIKSEIGKISRARKLNTLYSTSRVRRESHRRINGKV